MAGTFTSALDPVLVIIPTYNEAENINSIVARTRAAVPAADVLVADDNSPDGTGDLADALALSDGHVHVLHRAGKEGLGAAYVAGFHWGLERGYQVLVEMDADGSHQPEQLPALLDALKQADMVKGSRWVKGGSVVNWDARREFLSRAANIWVQAAMDINVRDATGGFNAFRAEILREIDLAEINSRGYTFQVDMTRRVLEAGGVVIEVPIQFLEREFGESKMSGAIIGEALIRTAQWGAQRRGAQLKALEEKAVEQLRPLFATGTPETEDERPDFTAPEGEHALSGLADQVGQVTRKAAGTASRLAHDAQNAASGTVEKLKRRLSHADQATEEVTPVVDLLDAEAETAARHAAEEDETSPQG